MHINEATRLAQAVNEALNWEMDDTPLIDGFLEAVGVGEVIDALINDYKDELVEAIGEQLEPDDVFVLEELEAWANERGYIQDYD
jgi:hypothetical protein